MKQADDDRGEDSDRRTSERVATRSLVEVKIPTWQAFRSVTLPFLAPLLVILTTLSVIWDFGVFNQIWFMRDGHPEPGYQTLGIYMYSQGIGSSHYNLGATVGVLMMLCLLVVMVFYIKEVFKIGNAE